MNEDLNNMKGNFHKAEHQNSNMIFTVLKCGSGVLEHHFMGLEFSGQVFVQRYKLFCFRNIVINYLKQLLKMPKCYLQNS